MKRAAVSELRASLSQHLARAKAGEDLLITERGKPVARLVPIRAQEGTADARMRDLERRGLVKMGDGYLPPDFWNLPRPKDSAGRVLKALVKERKQGPRSSGILRAYPADGG